MSLKLNPVSYRTLVFPEYGISNASNFSVALPLTASQRIVKQIIFSIYVNNAKSQIIVIP